MEINWTRGQIIGRGSTATVSIATSSSGEIFAVKSTDLSSSAILQKEQSILSTLISPHIIKYRGFKLTRENNGVVYNILMDYVSGGSLHDLIKKSGGKLPESMIRSYTCQILKGLMYLHERSIVHCDLKSRNVLVEENGDVLKIADFGCAKLVDNSEFSGTPAFMAPEVVRGEEQKFPADVWALGCTVIEMMTGLNPWPELNDVVAAMYKIGFSDESPEIPNWISENGKDFLMNCLKKDPKQRLTVEELLKHPFLDEEESHCLNKISSSPSTVLDQRFWDSCETSKSHLIIMDHEDPFVDYSDSRESPSNRIENLAGEWNIEDDGEWILVRGDEEATSSSVEDNEDLILNEDSLLSEYSLDDIIINNFYSNVVNEGNLITFYYYGVELEDNILVYMKKMFRNNSEDTKHYLSNCKLVTINLITQWMYDEIIGYPF